MKEALEDGAGACLLGKGAGEDIPSEPTAGPLLMTKGCLFLKSLHCHPPKLLAQICNVHRASVAPWGTPHAPHAAGRGSGAQGACSGPERSSLRWEQGHSGCGGRSAEGGGDAVGKKGGSSGHLGCGCTELQS